MMLDSSAAHTVSGVLGSDHDRLDDCFAQARRLATAGQLAEARRTFAELVDGLSRHIGLEERELFPVFESALRTLAPTTVMRHEHRAIEQLLTRGTSALDGGDGERFADVAAELEALLATHNVKEERVIYPRTDDALDSTERAALVGRLVNK